MSELSYFQRYSQKENVVTNNTLLMLRILYSASPQKLAGVLANKLDELNIGVSFSQQDKEASSIPDGHIMQEGFSIFIEAKLGGRLEMEQIKRHIKSISVKKDDGRKVLLGLTKSPISDTEIDKIKKLPNIEKIEFISMTFEELAGLASDQCLDHETNLQETVDDYRDFLVEEELVEAGELMTAVPCGQSMKMNKKFKLYACPASRPYLERTDFIGMYQNKKIEAIGRVATVVVPKMVAGEICYKEIDKGTLSDDQKERITEAIKHGKFEEEIKVSPLRFYLFDEIAESNYKKKSKGGLFGKKNFYLRKVLGDKYKPEMSLDDIVQCLNNDEWE